MPFLTQGKTNWKFLLIVVIVAVIVGGLILVWQWELDIIKIIQIQRAETSEEKCTLAGNIWRDSENCCCPKMCLIVYYLPGEEPLECLCCRGLYEEPEDETADWQTYRNEDYGFEFKYPNNFEEREILGTRGQPTFYPILGLDVPFTGADLFLSIGLSDLTDCFYSSLNQSIKKEKIIINNKEFCLNIDLDSGPSMKHKRCSYSTESIVEGRYIIFEFVAEFNPYCGVYSEYECDKFDEDKAVDLFERILYTFKFLD